MAADRTALFEEARAAFERRDLAAARELCDEALALKRTDFNALMLKSNVASAEGNIREAIELVKAAVMIQRQNPALRVHLGQRYLTAGDPAKAIAQFEKALRLEPGRPEAIAGQAAAHEAKGRYDAARRVLAPLVRGPSPRPDAAAVQMRLLLEAGDVEGAVALGERVATAGHRASLELRATLFSLAKAYELRGEPEAAFGAARRAHEILAAPYDPAAMEAWVDDIVRTLSRAAVAALPRPAEPSDVPVFIVGMPRTGSTLTERILDVHPEAHGGGELDLMLPILGGLAARTGLRREYPAWVTALGPHDVEWASATYLKALRRLAPRARRISNKYLGHLPHIGLFAALFPAARFIHCRRDPLDTCLSCHLERLFPEHVPFARDLRWLGAYHRLYERLMAHWRDALDVEILDVEYEAIVNDQEATTRRILEFCGLPWDDACLRFHERARPVDTLSAAQVRQPLYSTAVGRAARFGALLDPLREALAGR